MKKRIMAVLLAAASVVAVAGCSNSGSGSSDTTTTTAATAAADNGGAAAADTTAAGGESSTTLSSAETLSLLAWEGNSDVVAMIDYFCEQTGHSKDEIKYVAVGSNGEGARDGYHNYLLGDGDADLLFCDADWIQAYVNSDETLGYDQIGLSKSDFPDAFSYTLSVGTSTDGVFKANSFQATPGGFVYRADLAKEYLGVNSPDEMQALVSDWDKFQETAATVQAKSDGKCSLQATEGGLWQVFQANRNQPWVVDGKLVMDTAEDFYDIAKTFNDNKYMAGVPQWNSAWYAAVQDGTAMGDFVPTWGLTTSQGSILYNFAKGEEGKGADLSGSMAICEGPAGWYWGGTYMAVANKCDSNDLAKEWIEFFCKNADTMKGYAEKTGDFVNNSAVMGSIEGSNPLLNGQNHYAILVKVMAKLDLEGKITQYDSVIKGKFNDSVNAYLDGTQATKEDAIKQFKTDVAGALPDVTVE